MGTTANNVKIEKHLFWAALKVSTQETYTYINLVAHQIGHTEYIHIYLWIIYPATQINEKENIYKINP